MSQVIVKRKQDDELYHSDTYLGEEFDEGLMHFKYVSKEKKNGKWHYYYYHKEGKNSAAMYEKTEGNPKSKYGVYTHDGGATTSGGGRTVVVEKSNRLLSRTDRLYTNAKTNSYFERRAVGKIEQNYDYISNKISKWSKKTIKQLDKSVNKGKKWINKLLKAH